MPGKDVKTMNRVILMGRLTKNPEIKYAGKDNDMAVARYTLAVNRKYKRDGEQEADFISCVTFGKSAESFISAQNKKRQQYLRLFFWLTEANMITFCIKRPL